MARDLSFWKISKKAEQSNNAIYSALCKEEYLDYVDELPTNEIQAAINKAFADWENFGNRQCEKGNEAFDLFITKQFVRFDCHGVSDENMNRIIDICLNTIAHCMTHLLMSDLTVQISTIRRRKMSVAKLEYCIDGYDLKEEEIRSFNVLKNRLLDIKIEAAEILNGIFTVDIVVENKGRMSIGLDENSILAYTSHDFAESLTSLGDETRQGSTIYYFGDYSCMSNKYIISYEKALNALKIWVERGEVSTEIRWSEQIIL